MTGTQFNTDAGVKEIEYLLQRPMTSYEFGLWDGICEALMQNVETYYAIDNATEALRLFFVVKGISAQDLLRQHSIKTLG